MSASVQSSIEVANSGLAATRLILGLMGQLKELFADQDGLQAHSEAYRIGQMGEWVAEQLKAELTGFQARCDAEGWPT